MYAVTDRTWFKDRELKDVVEEAIEGGTSFLQLREKKLNLKDFEA
ncbi:MAG: thiamine phosphate synthase [Clostridium sp.]|nr:thiamine phosphate synthase [Clostridium sp.]